MIEIPLGNALFALVDDEDVELVCRHKWRAAKLGRASLTQYAVTSVKNETGVGPRQRTLLMHRLILGVSDRGTYVDHANRNGLDNRRCNLRIATRSQNCANRRTPSHNTTGLRGVHFKLSHKSYVATISHNGRKLHLGYFKKAEDAYAAYVAAGRKLFGPFFDL